MKIEQWSIYKRSVLLGALPMVFAFLVLLIAFTYERIGDLEKQWDEEGQLVVNQLAPSVEYSLISGDVTNIKSIMNAAMGLSVVEYVVIRNNEGALFSEQRRDLTVPLEQLMSSVSIKPYVADVVQQNVVIDSGFELEEVMGSDSDLADAVHLGVVIVGVNIKALEDEVWLVIYKAGAASLFVFFISTLVFRSLSRSISRPLESLSVTLTKIKQGHYDARADFQGGPEVRQLAADVNLLSNALYVLDIDQEEQTKALKSAYEKEQKLTRVKSEFLTLVSHELRTPINGIMGMLQMLADTDPDSEQQELLNIAQSSTEHLLSLIGDVLDYSKIEQGDIRIDNVDFNLGKFVRDVASSFSVIAKEKGITFDFECDDDQHAYIVRSDSSRIRQILTNLIGNAIKFTSKGGVKIRSCGVVENGNLLRYQCEIHDTGIGIPKDKIDNIFAAFGQIDQSSVRKHGGAGLGLPISKALLDKMDGRISVHSQLDEGSCFVISLTFPIVGSSVVAEITKQTKTFAENTKVLVVEDNVINQKVAVGMLKKFKFNISTANNGQEAVEFFQSHAIDFILMDCQMPVMDGFEATRLIREYEVAQNKKPTPIIALTADISLDAENNCYESGMNDYLAKPLKKDQIQRVMDKWC